MEKFEILSILWLRGKDKRLKDDDLDKAGVIEKEEQKELEDVLKV